MIVRLFVRLFISLCFFFFLLCLCGFIVVDVGLLVFVGFLFVCLFWFGLVFLLGRGGGGGGMPNDM